MNGIEEIGFAHTIWSGDGHDHFFKRKALMTVIFKLGDSDRSQEHGLQDKKRHPRLAALSTATLQ